MSTINNMLAEVAGRIKAMREIAGYSIEYMAEKTEVSIAEYERYESGKSDLPFTFIHKCSLALDVDITDVFLEKDPFGHLNTISLDLIIKNNSKTDFSSFDIALVSDLRQSYTPSIFTDYRNSLAMQTIKKGTNVSGILSFSVDNPKRQHWLVFYDKRTHKPLAKISVDNAQKRLNIKDLEKNKKKRKRV